MEYCKNCVSEDCELINASERRARIFVLKKYLPGGLEDIQDWYKYLGGVNFYASAWNGAAGEMLFLGLDEDNLTINGCMDGEVTAHKCAWTCDLGCAGLADKYFASVDLLAAETFDTETLAGVVV